MQFGGNVGGRARWARGAAPAQSAAIIRGRRCEARDRLLNVKPVQIGGGNPRFKDHGGSARSFFHEVESALATNVDPAAIAGVAPAVAALTEALIHNTR